jgi:hypothetical protein
VKLAIQRTALRARQKALENLRDGDGHEISPEMHATCPGRAVTIT